MNDKVKVITSFNYMGKPLEFTTDAIIKYDVCTNENIIEIPMQTIKLRIPCEPLWIEDNKSVVRGV